MPNWCYNELTVKGKWDAGDVVCEATDKEAWLSFDTAWSPPTPVIKKMGEMFPRLIFLLTYSEEGDGFEGEFFITRNIIVRDVCRESDLSRDESRYT